MEAIPKEKQRITAERAITLLKDQGVELLPEQAELVVEFFYSLAVIFYVQQEEL